MKIMDRRQHHQCPEVTRTKNINMQTKVDKRSIVQRGGLANKVFELVGKRGI